MEIPQEVREIVRSAYAEYPEDMGAALELAIKMVSQSENYEDLRQSLVARAIEGLLQEERHILNTQLRKASGGYGEPAKVRIGGSRAVADVFRSYYAYAIGGRTLGSLLGKELKPLADKEMALAGGHMFRARLLMSLNEVVGPEESVQDRLTEAQLKKVFQSVEDDDTEELAA